MFLPEYTITSKILRNIAAVEYAKAVIENTTILQNWENKLKKEAKMATIQGIFSFRGQNINPEEIKRFVDELPCAVPKEVHAINTAYTAVETMAEFSELNETNVKKLNKLLVSNSQTVSYRKKRAPHATNPGEILAEMVEFTDWYHSLDARETHPLILAGITKAQLDLISPFEGSNDVISNLAAKVALKSRNYTAKNLFSIEGWFGKTKWDYEKISQELQEEQEYTSWLEYFTEGLSLEFSTIKEKVLLLAKNTKLAKVSGRIKLSSRQERIVEYIQDYGLLQNKDFSQVFPDISEDSVLRDLKRLISMGIIIKTGSTKSSRYEIA